MAVVDNTEAFSLRPVPEVHFGVGRVDVIAEDAAALNRWDGTVVLVADATLHELGVTGKVTKPLIEAGANDLYSHHALRLIAGALVQAVEQPGNLEARGAMLLGSAYAGMAIDNCSAGMAHNISHAIATLGPINHGLATALGLEVVLAWQAVDDDGPFAAAAAACGVDGGAGELADRYTDPLDRIGIERRLPDAFVGSTAADLVREMTAPETQYMRLSSRRPVTDADIERFAIRFMDMVPVPGTP